VGLYTTGAIASFAFDLPVAAVDANIARVLARMIDLSIPVDSKAGSDAVWSAAEMLLPPVAGGRIHNSALMELGALLCIPRQPQCLVCPVREDCQAKEPERLPIKKPRRATVQLIEDCAWSFRDGRVLLEQQTGNRWKGLWKLPRLEDLPPRPPLLEAEYPFTHHRVTLRVFDPDEVASVKEQPSGTEWVAIGDLESTAIAAPHKRAIVELLSRA
jgi:A/G-specific adenine glycosylase